MRLVSCRCRHVYVPPPLRVTARREPLRVCSRRTAEQRIALVRGSRKHWLRRASLGVVFGLATSQISRLRLLQTPRASADSAFKAHDIAHPLPLQCPLGIDFGQARIGLAICPGGFVSTPLKILDSRRRVWLELAEEIIGIARQQGVDGFVVGLPVTRQGNIRRRETDSVQGKACRNFAQILHAIARPHALPVFLFDERMTSADAAAALGIQGESRLKQKGKLDAVAAAMLLTAYFERPEGAMKVKSIKHRS